MLARVLGYPVLFVAGAVMGVCGVFVSRSEYVLAGVALPYGLVLSLAALLGVLLCGARLGMAGVLVAAGGWALPTVAFLVPRSEGDIILGADWLGLAYLLVGLGLVLWAVIRSTGPGPSPGR